MNMFKPTSAKTPEEYIGLIEEPRKSEIEKLHKFIKKTVPGLRPHILVGMIGYGTFHYKSPSGREGDWSIIALASQKNYISVYICASDGKQYLPEKYKDKFPKANIGRSCIRFKLVEDIDLKVLEKIIKEAVKSPQFAV
jgi:hypothetical protein